MACCAETLKKEAPTVHRGKRGGKGPCKDKRDRAPTLTTLAGGIGCRGGREGEVGLTERSSARATAKKKHNAEPIWLPEQSPRGPLSMTREDNGLSPERIKVSAPPPSRPRRRPEEKTSPRSLFVQDPRQQPAQGGERQRGIAPRGHAEGHHRTASKKNAPRGKGGVTQGSNLSLPFFFCLSTGTTLLAWCVPSLLSIDACAPWWKSNKLL